MDSEKDENSKTKRRNTAIFRRNSIKSETTSVASCRTQSTVLNSSSSDNSTPKNSQKIQKHDFCVTGKQFLRKSERASSTGVLGRRKSVDSVLSGGGCKNVGYGKKCSSLSQSFLKGRCTEMSVGEDMTLDISEISGDKNDTLTSLRSKRQHLKKKMPSVATSTPRNLPKVFQKPRSASVQAVRNPIRKRDQKKCEKSFDSCESSRSAVTCSDDSVLKTYSTDSYRNAQKTDLDNSSVSPECSESSCERSPRTSQQSDVAVVSPFSQRSQLSASSSFYSSWMETNTDRSRQMAPKEDNIGEWNEFWSNYNNSLNKVSLQNYYDLCPTPYRSDSIGIADLDFLSEETLQQKSPNNMEMINEIIRNDGIQLTPRETQNLIKCTHILGNVLSKALDRNAKQKRNATEEEKILELLRGKNSKPTEIPKPNPEYLTKKANLTLDLKEEIQPMQVKPEISFDTLGTQTDISLPNTKSAPRIFEKILRQLSRTSIDDQLNRKSEELIAIPGNICEGNVNKSDRSDLETDEAKNIDKSDKSVTPSVEKTE